jgi:hypothetical protein
VQLSRTFERESDWIEGWIKCEGSGSVGDARYCQHPARDPAVR